jgi:molybdopterin converting factor small subunit
MPTIIIPTPLRKYTNNNSHVKLSEKTVSGAISQLTEDFPDIKNYLMDAEGKMAPFINVFVDSEDIRNLDLENTTLQDNSIINIVPAIAGGVRFPNDYDPSQNRIQLV